MIMIKNLLTKSKPSDHEMMPSSISTKENDENIKNNLSNNVNGTKVIKDSTDKLLNINRSLTIKSLDVDLLNKKLDDIKKNLLNSVKLHRNDIVVSLINEWFKIIDDVILNNTVNHNNNSNNTNNNSDNSNNTNNDNNETINTNNLTLINKYKYFFNELCYDNDTKTILHIAYELNDRDIVRTLINFGASPDIKDKINNKCLTEYIIYDNNTEMKQILIDSFLQAIAQNNIVKIKQLLNSGIDINSSDGLVDGSCFLHWAVLYSNEKLIRFLLDNGANVNQVNKMGATALHECIYKRKDFNIIETLLLYKADVLNIKATSGIYKDKSALDLCENDSDLHNFILDFLHTTNSEPTTPTLNKTIENNQHQQNNNNNNNQSNQNISNHELPQQQQQQQQHQFESFNNWCSSNTETINPIDLLWPKPQSIQIENDSNKYFLINNNNINNTNVKSLYVYIKPPYTYKLTEFINKLVSVYSDISFIYIHKNINNVPHIQLNIDDTLFNVTNSYEISVKENVINICSNDLIGLQYAFCTLLQLIKVYKYSIPQMKIFDYPSTKYRGLLIDLSNGFYFKHNYLLSLLQMFAFYKINQVHFYVKFSTNNFYKRQWYHCLEHWFDIVKFCDDFNLTIVPTIDLYNDVAELDDVLPLIKDYLDLFKSSKFINVGPRLTSLLICMEDKNPFELESNQYLMLCSYLYHNNDEDINDEINKFDKLILMEYGFKVGHNFANKCKTLDKSGKPYYLCVGTSNWNSLLGCPDGCLLNIFDAISNTKDHRPLGLLLCEFTGALTKTPFGFNLNSTVMFAGPSWNNNISLKHVKDYLPQILTTHGLISDKDGSIGIIMLELGNIETYLTRKSINLLNYDGLPLDVGSIFSRLIINPNDIELDNLDISILKKLCTQIRKLQLKLKTLIIDNINQQFKEVYIYTELALSLLKFLMTLFNAGTKQQTNTIGFNVINIGVSNINETVKTDLANKILSVKAELEDTWKLYYYEDSIQLKTKLFENLIDKLLSDNDKNSLSNDMINNINNNNNQVLVINDSQTQYFNKDYSE